MTRPTSTRAGTAARSIAAVAGWSLFWAAVVLGIAAGALEWRAILNLVHG